MTNWSRRAAHGRPRGRRAAALLTVAFLFAPAACDGDARSAGPRLVRAGDAQIEVDPDAIGATTSTLPMAEEDIPVVQRLGSTFADFRACLEREGFGGRPIPMRREEFEKTEPDYLDALARCNNETGMVEVLQEFQNESKNLDPDEIELRNQGLILFRQCLLRRNWEFPELSTDQYGALSVTGAPLSPPGRDSARDFSECGQQATSQVSEAAAEAAEEAEDES